MTEREPMKLPASVEDWPERLVRGDWYVALNGEEIMLADHWVRKSDSKTLNVTPPPPFD